MLDGTLPLPNYDYIQNSRTHVVIQNDNQRRGGMVKFCTECGNPVSRQWITEEGRERLVCGSCKVIHYQNPRVIVACAAFWHHKLLMCRRACEPGRGTWIIPSGYLETGETLQEGAVRETFEEAGVALDPYCMFLHSAISLVPIGQVAIVFRSEILNDPTVQAGPECLDVAFLSEEEILGVDLAWPDITSRLTRDLFAQRRKSEHIAHLVNIGFEPTDESFGTKLRSC
jgi:ADP-ribose pyrophosphatase YjhB (NUDIX family)